jgi:hypothetical protein
LHKLRVKDSTIPGAGKGLFAQTKNNIIPVGSIPTRDREIIFRKGQKIIDYNGEKMGMPGITERYGEYTAPYALKVRGAHYEDAACKRGTGAMVNHSARSRSNARFSFVAKDQDDELGRPKSVVLADKVIRDGDEILINYGDDYQFNENIQHGTRRR